MFTCSGQPSGKGLGEAHKLLYRKEAVQMHQLTSAHVLPQPGCCTTAGHVSQAQTQPTGDTTTAAVPCPRTQEQFCRLHSGQKR